jgi:hypothetical protein
MPFAPSDLFTGGYTGEIYDFADTSLMWTDEAATTPITADGDAIGAIDGQFAGTRATKASGTAAVYKTNILNGLAVGRFSTSVLRTTLGVYIIDPSLECTIFSVAMQTSVADQAIVATINAATGTIQRFRNNGGTQQVRWLWPLQDNNTGVGANNFAFYTSTCAAKTGTNGIVSNYVNGSLIGSSSSGARSGTPQDAGAFRIGSTATGTQALTGDIAYLLVINKLVAGTELSDMHDWLDTRFFGAAPTGNRRRRALISGAA